MDGRVRVLAWMLLIRMENNKTLIVLLLGMWVNIFRDRGREGRKSIGFMIHQVKLKVLRIDWIPCSKQNDLFSSFLSIPTAPTVEGT